VPILFDMELRALRRDRAARNGAELFLFERAFEDCLDRISLVRRQFGKALLIGCPSSAWTEQLRAFAGVADVADPGALFASAAGGQQIVEDDWEWPIADYDLVVALGTLDTVNDLPRVLRSIRQSMQPDALLIGAMSGGDTLPQLRAAMRVADRITGEASAHVHPRIEASGLTALLSASGFAEPVVDIDRVQVSYASLNRLIGDLRAMGATNILVARSRRSLTRSSYRAAEESFVAGANGDRTTEVFEILHFAAWRPSAGQG
jgi:SAM-dependent methyltransferase